MKQLSIILPVYNVEKYILPCLNSLYSQNMNEDDYEIIIVNDGSRDHSMEIIDEITKQHNNIIIINQENQGVSIARNNGLKKACGEYVLFVDSDDILVTEKLPDLIKNAIASKADIIVADYKKMDDNDILQYHEIPQIDYGGNIIIEKKGWTLYVEDFDPHECYIWRILIRREFLSRNNILFTPNIFYEDIPFTHTCYIKANKCLKTNYLLYIYRIGHTSITSRLDKKTGMDFGTAISKSWDLLNTNRLPYIVKQKLKDNIFISLSALLYGIIHEVQQKTERKEILHHMLLYTPNIYFSHGIKQRFVSFMINKMPYLYIETRVVYAKFIKRNIRY